MCKQLKSGYLAGSCECNTPKAKQHRTAGLSGPDEPANEAAKETKKDVIDEAQKYSNTEVPTYNKVFGITLVILTAMILNGGK